MRVEKQSSRSLGNRYAGGFIHLFDLHATSNKKLLSRSLDLSEEPKQNGSSYTNMPFTRFQPAREDYTSSSSMLQGCVSSPIGKDDYCKAPGVVARLMGLNSLPNSNFSAAHSNQNHDSRSLHNASALDVRKSPELGQKDYHQMEQKHKVIEKFQTESLPPKSARSVPITQHKLLSPVKNPRFVSSNDPYRIMEAAVKIPLVRSSSSATAVSFPARKSSKASESNGRSTISGNARLGPPRRPVESNAARNLKGQSMNKSWDGCLNTKPFLEEGKKSVSLALQAKVNVKKREGLISSSRRSFHGAESVESQQNIHKNTLKKTANSVLKQNNHKQNSSFDGRKSAVKSSASPINSQCQKPVPEKSLSNISFNPANKTVNRRKRFSEDVKNKVHDKSNRSRNVGKSNGLDVVSFTFTSPISHSVEKKTTFLADNRKNTLTGFNRNISGLNSTTGGESVITLLDQKFKELSVSSSPSVSRESSTNYRARISRTVIFQDKKTRGSISKDDLLCRFSPNYHQVAEETSEYRKLAGDCNPSIVSLSGPCFLLESCVSSYATNTYDTDVFSKNLEGCTNSESAYMKDILTDIESMFENFTLGRTQKIINPPLFDQLEAQRHVLEKQTEPKLRRKLVFDCVSECVDSRCRVWQRGLEAVRRKDELAKEVCNKILGWEQMKDCMVDELVDEDMSSDQHKKWVDFDVEAFEVGVEMERRLLSFLINEALDDMVVL